MNSYEEHQKSLKQAITELKEAEALYSDADTHQWDYARTRLIAARERVDSVIKSAKLLDVKPKVLQKHTIKNYYIIPFLTSLLNFKDLLLEKVLGFWYCHYCGKLHGPLVMQYDPTARNFYVCSIGEDKPYKLWVSSPIDLTTTLNGFNTMMTRVSSLYSNPKEKKDSINK
jgi:hypothetical protein